MDFEIKSERLLKNNENNIHWNKAQNKPAILDN